MSLLLTTPPPAALASGLPSLIGEYQQDHRRDWLRAASLPSSAVHPRTPTSICAPWQMPIHISVAKDLLLVSSASGVRHRLQIARLHHRCSRGEII